MSKKEALLQKKIDANISKIKRLANENIYLQDKINTSGKYKEEHQTFGRGKKKVTKFVGRKYWKEDFKDEDSGEAITIERSRIVRIDGKIVDEFGNEIEYYTV